MTVGLDREIEQSFARLMATAKQRSADLDAFLATQPPAVNCPLHPGSVRQLDNDLSRRASNQRGEPTAGYLPCPYCQAAASAQVEAERLHRQGVPLNLCGATFENWTPHNEQEEAALSRVREFARTRAGFLLLLGDLGTGKSHLAVSVMRGFRSALFIKQSELLRRLRDTYRDKAAVDPVEQAQGAGLFVIDEMGLSSGGRDELPMLHDILDFRHGERKPTILTANADLKLVEQVIGERMADRLRESVFAVLSFGGASHRREMQERYFA